MILGFTCSQLAFIVIISLLSGASGAGIVLTVCRLVRKKRRSKTANRIKLRNDWQKMSRDEQLYNGR